MSDIMFDKCIRCDAVMVSSAEAVTTEITTLRAEVKKLCKDLSLSVFADSEYCKVLERENERLLKSRNRWAQKYNDLLNKRRAEDGHDVYAAAREEYRKKIKEQAAEVERLKAALRQIAGIDTWDDSEQGYVDKARAALGDTP